jgi:hypothetical protein
MSHIRNFGFNENDLVEAVDPLDYRIELALNEAILVDVLRSSPACVLDHASFAAECARRSMNINTFSLYLTYSPVIVHLGTDIWSLRGVRVDPAAVEAVRSANVLRPREKRVLDHGWAVDGRLADFPYLNRTSASGLTSPRFFEACRLSPIPLYRPPCSSSSRESMSIGHAKAQRFSPAPGPLR